MGKWNTRLGGAVVAILAFVHGLPGFLDDSMAWAGWVRKMEIVTYLSAIGVLGGVILATSEWWWPRLRSALQRTAQDTDVQALKGLLPLINRCKYGYSGSVNPTIKLLNLSIALPIEHDITRLFGKLDALGIPHPDESNPKSLYRYLEGLSVLCERGKLEEARSLWKDA
jgi:hypothetical protein